MIEKFNCTGCHTLEMERWDLAFAPDTFGEPAEMVGLPASSSRTSRRSRSRPREGERYRGMQHATITGMPAVNDEGQPVRVDEDGAPIEPDDTETPASYVFAPWENVLLNGKRLAGRLAERDHSRSRD